MGLGQKNIWFRLIVILSAKCQMSVKPSGRVHWERKQNGRVCCVSVRCQAARIKDSRKTKEKEEAEAPADPAITKYCSNLPKARESTQRARLGRYTSTLPASALGGDTRMRCLTFPSSICSITQVLWLGGLESTYCTRNRVLPLPSLPNFPC